MDGNEARQTIVWKGGAELKDVWLVFHQRTLDVEVRGEDISPIGFFSSFSLAQNAIEFLSEKDGFRDDIKGFRTQKIPLDQPLEQPAYVIHEDWTGGAEWDGWSAADYLESEDASRWSGSTLLVLGYRKDFLPARKIGDEDEAWFHLVGVWSSYERAHTWRISNSVVRNFKFCMGFFALDEITRIDGFVFAEV